MREPLLYRMSEAAKLLAVSRSTAYELAKSGALPTVRVGRSLRVPRVALERLSGLQLAPADSDDRAADRP